MTVRELAMALQELREQGRADQEVVILGIDGIGTLTSVQANGTGGYVVLHMDDS